MKRMLIDANHEEETRVAILDRKQILEFDYASTTRKQIKGNVYLAKVTRVEPSLQAAFVEYGGGRQGFLPFSEIHPDYYQIPVSDRKKLMEEVERELQEDAEQEEAEFEARQSRGNRRTRGRRVRRRGKRDDSSDNENTENTENTEKADNKEASDSEIAPDTQADSTDSKNSKDIDSKKSDSKTDSKAGSKAAKSAAKKEDKGDTEATSKETAKDSDKNSDDPKTQYAKKDEPSIQSDVVDGVDAKADADADGGSETKEPTEKKKRTRRSPLRGGRKRVSKKDKEAEEVKATKEADAVETAETASDNADRLGVNAPTEVGLGAALFSEDKPFDLPGNEATEAAADDKKDDKKAPAKGKKKSTAAKKKPAPAAESDVDGEEAEEDIETLDSEEESVKPARKKRVPFFKRYKIQEVIKRGQVVLVQATKEERGNKGASVTTYLSLAGRYCVLMPNSPRDGGVSRKISDAETRKRLKDVMSQLTLSQGMSVIIRTAGIDRNRTEIRRDFDYLVKLWNQIREGTLSANAPALIYEENNLIKRAIRDLYTSDIDEVLVEGDEAYKESREFMEMLMPSHTSRVKQYTGDMPLYYEHGIEDHLASMHDPVAKLKSGGYLVINPTEALISIDVNSGRSTGERNIEETALKNNIEAAHEVARQLRLRDLAGLIVIDFIDMMDSRNRRAVERNLKDALRSDRAKIQVGRISPFGLMEMSRQRLRPSIGETMHTQCPTCDGRGLVHAPESLALFLIRTLEKEAVSGRFSELKLFVSQEVALYVLNNKRSLITGIEQRHDIDITIDVDTSLSVSDYNIEKVRATKAPRGKKKDSNVDADSKEERPRRGRPRRNDRNAKKSDDSVAEESASDVGENAAESSGDDKEVKKPARGRPRKSKKDDADKDEAANSNDSKKASSSDADNSSESLPEFTKKAVVEDKKEKPVPVEPAQEAPPPPDTSRPKGAPARKGWWQQMIELD